MRSLPLLCVLLIGSGLLTASDAAAQGCQEDDTTWLGISAGVGAGVGAGAALGSAGVIAAVDDSRDFSFALGAGVGIGVSLGIAGLYALIDGSSGCHMVQDAGGMVWSVPITTWLVGALLPVAVWGASDKMEPTQETSMPLSLPLNVRLHF